MASVVREKSVILDISNGEWQYCKWHYQILLIHAVNVWSDDCEVLHPLRRRRIGNVDGHFDVIPNGTWLRFEAARQTAFRQLKFERKRMVTTDEHRSLAF